MDSFVLFREVLQEKIIVKFCYNIAKTNWLNLLLHCCAFILQNNSHPPFKQLPLLSNFLFLILCFVHFWCEKKHAWYGRNKCLLKCFWLYRLYFDVPAAFYSTHVILNIGIPKNINWAICDNRKHQNNLSVLSMLWQKYLLRWNNILDELVIIIFSTIMFNQLKNSTLPSPASSKKKSCKSLIISSWGRIIF